MVVAEILLAVLKYAQPKPMTTGWSQLKKYKTIQTQSHY